MADFNAPKLRKGRSGNRLCVYISIRERKNKHDLKNSRELLSRSFTDKNATCSYSDKNIKEKN